MREDKPRKVLITGAHGFIGRNLSFWLREKLNVDILEYLRSESLSNLESKIEQADTIVHLAGENRPSAVEDFNSGNVALTNEICEIAARMGKAIPIIFTSSTQAQQDNPYGESKYAAEKILTQFSQQTQTPVTIFRLPGVFGKWSRPNYNSVVATFCFNIARDNPVDIHDESAEIELVYIDDLMEDFVRHLLASQTGFSWGTLSKTYKITVGELAERIHAFKRSRENLITEPVGTGLARALYSTYMSFLPKTHFTYELPKHGDKRGDFVEMLKTKDSGQISFFTISAKGTRGSHYHHSKSEKFLVVKGRARLRFRHLVTGEMFEVLVSSERPEVVDSIPGWVHDITNMSDSDLIVLLWANEVFDRDAPDTFSAKV